MTAMVKGPDTCLRRRPLPPPRSEPSRPPGGAATPRWFVTFRSRFRLRRFRRVPPKRAHQPADHVGGRENDDGAERDGCLRDEPRLRCLGGNVVHCCVLYLFTGGRIEGHRQEPVLSPPRRFPASNRLGIRARERAWPERHVAIRKLW